MTQLLASLKNIEKFYQSKVLTLEKLDIIAGKCLIITGNNGSGKSTLLKIINGLISADYGSIDYQNQSYMPTKGHILASQSVYLSTKPYLFDCSVERNVAYPLWINKHINQANKVEEMLTWANIKHLRRRRANTLSSGERQRVALARANILNPPIWLLDETIENLDVNAKQQFYDLLNKLLSERRSVIIATHSEEILRRVPNTSINLNSQNEDH